MKKWLALFLVLFLIPVSFAQAEEQVEKPEILTCKNFEYVLLEDETAEIYRYNGEEEQLSIPEKLDGVHVTRIGDYAFAFCTSLTSVTIPDSVLSIGGNPFLYCSRLTDIFISPGHPYLSVIDGVLFSKPDNRLVCYPCALTKDSYTIPNDIRIIGESAFISCSSLASVTIPDSVTYIGYGAFEGCDSLISIMLPDSITYIGENPFWGCGKLTNIIVSPDHPYLAVIDGVLFSKPDNRLVCYPCMLGKDSYTIPDGIQMIGEGAFTSCKSLMSVIIPDSVTSIGDYAFDGCKSLTSITIPDGVTSLGDSVFYFCRSLTSITIPDSVTSIGDNAFSYCRRLTNITIPDTVTSIGKDTFQDCPFLTATVGRNSFATRYCEENDIPYTYSNAND